VLAIRRWVVATPAGRRTLLPITVAGLVMASAVIVEELFWRLTSWLDFPGDSLWRSVGLFLTTYVPMMEQLSPIIGRVTVVAFPVALLWGLLRSRLGGAAVGDLAVRLRTADAGREPEQIREAVRRALGDPSLEIALWSRTQQCWMNELSIPVEVPVDDGRFAITRLDSPDGPLAVLIHDPALNDRPELVSGVTAVAQMALENARLHAEVRSQLEEVRRSRERIVRAADDERRRVERDIHDGAQQRLVSLSLALGMARSQASTASPALAETLTRADKELRAAINELRELARGIHPAVLTEAGLGPALESLGDHASIPVTVRAELDGRLPPVVEATAYFVAAEALTKTVATRLSTILPCTPANASAEAKATSKPTPKISIRRDLSFMASSGCSPWVASRAKPPLKRHRPLRVPTGRASPSGALSAEAVQTAPSYLSV
jgi:signal transduction histidine kinase